MTLHDLAHEWQVEAERLRARYGLEEMAKLCEAHASELSEAIRTAEDEELTISEAARESGYSTRRLCELVSAGEVPNAGERGRPRIKRADLPRKARASAGSFDAAGHAADILGAQ